MSLPAARNTTYSNSDPVKSADLNAIQDSIVSGKHGQITRQIPMTLYDINDDIAFATNATAGSNYLIAQVATHYYAGHLGLDVGATLVGAKAKVYWNAGVAPTLKLYKQNLTAGSAPGTPSQLGSTQTATPTGTNILDISVTGLSEVTVAEWSYFMLVSLGNSASIRLYAAYVTFSKL